MAGEAQDPKRLARPKSPGVTPEKATFKKRDKAGSTGAMTKPLPAGVQDADAVLKKELPAPTKGLTRTELTKQYIAYVRSIAGGIWRTLSKDIEFDDLVGYGMLGLYEAADRFDPKFGANFMTFSYYRIRGAIYDGLRGMGWISRNEYQKYRFEARANAYINSVHDRDLAQPVGAAQGPEKKKGDDEEVRELADVVTGLVTIYVTALDAMKGLQIKDDRNLAVDDVLDLVQSQAMVGDAVERLPDQEKKLIQLYYYKEQSLEEVGKALGLSKSWTSRLHARAIDKLGRILKEILDEHYEVDGVSVHAPKKANSTQQSDDGAR